MNTRGRKGLISQVYRLSEREAFDALIDEGINSQHIPLTDAFWDEVRKRGRKLAAK